MKKTPYEVFKGRKPNISRFKYFGCKCFVLNNGKDNLGKFDGKVYVDIFLGYSSHSYLYGVYNKKTMTAEEFMHILFDEANLELRDVSKNSANGEDSSDLLQGNNRLFRN